MRQDTSNGTKRLTCSTMSRPFRVTLTVWGCPLAMFLWSMSMLYGSLVPPRLYRICRFPSEKEKNVKSTLRYFDLYSPAIFPSLFSHTAVIISHLIALIAGLCSKRRAGVWYYKVTGLKLPLVYYPEVWQWPASPNHSVCKHSRLQTKQIGVMPWTIWTIGTKLSTSSNTLLSRLLYLLQ